MATRRKPVTKAHPVPTASVEERLAEALAEKPKQAERNIHHDAPAIGDKVSVGNSETVYTVIRVNHTGTEVDLHLEGTNIERFRVSIGDIKFVDRRQRSAPAKPVKPRIDIECIHERLVVAQHDSIQHVSAQIAQLKQQLKLDGAPANVARDLDKLCTEVEESWDATIRAIMERLA
jgi:hypothetical protein